jgi:hypothetical protein
MIDVRSRRSARRGQRPYSSERAGEVALPGPASGEVKRPLPAAASQPAGDREQPPAQRAGDTEGVTR